MTVGRDRQDCAPERGSIYYEIGVTRSSRGRRWLVGSWAIEFNGRNCYPIETRPLLPVRAPAPPRALEFGEAGAATEKFAWAGLQLEPAVARAAIGTRQFPHRGQPWNFLGVIETPILHQAQVCRPPRDRTRPSIWISQPDPAWPSLRTGLRGLSHLVAPMPLEPWRAAHDA